VGINQKILYNLETNCLFHLSSACDYLINCEVGQEDYSLEFAIHETLYAFEVLNRALGSNKKQSDLYVVIKESIGELLNDIQELNFKNRFSTFLNEYYSKDIFKSLVHDLVNSKQKEINDEDFDLVSYKAIDTFLIFDRIKLIQKSQFIQSYQFDLSRFYDNINSIFCKHESVWNHFSDIIKSAYHSMLIPKDLEYDYWHNYCQLSIEEIDNIFESYIQIKLQNIFISDSITSALPNTITNIKSIFQKSVFKLRQLPDFNQIVDEVLNTPNVQPTFATYSKNQTIDPNLASSFIKHQGSLETLIEKIEDLDLDESDKLDLLAVLYIIFGKHEKAKDILK